MKLVMAVLSLLACATVACAQNPDPAKWMCRNVSESGGFVYQGETVFGTQACRPIQQAAAPTKAAASPTTVSMTAPPDQVQAAPAPAQQPDVPEQEQPAESVSTPNVQQAQATIYFYRPRRFQGSALRPSIFVDDARVGNLHNGDSLRFSITPGNHRIYSTDKSTGMELDAKAGETYYVRVDIQVGFFKGHGGVTLIDPQQGKYEVAQAAHQGADNNQ